MKISKNKLLLVDYHVISQVIETELVVGNICNIAVIRLTSLVCCGTVEYDSDLKSEEFMHLPHPFSISLCQVVVDSYNMDTLSFKGIQINRKC